MLIWLHLTWSCCGVMVKSSDFHPVGPGSIPGADIFQEFSKSPRFSKFCEITWNQQLLFYYSMRRGSVVQYSDSNSYINVFTFFPHKMYRIHTSTMVCAFFSKVSEFSLGYSKQIFPVFCFSDWVWWIHFQYIQCSTKVSDQLLHTYVVTLF